MTYITSGMVLCILIVPGNDVEHRTVTPISLIISIYTPHHIASHHINISKTQEKSALG
jgi:hypothetical protein